MKHINARRIIRPFAALALAATVTQASVAAHVDVVGSGEPASAVSSQSLRPDAVVGAQGPRFWRLACGASIALTLLSPAGLLVAFPTCYHAFRLSTV